jgi:ectoine hydroxylase-related dioxygenase (phytanoyl-CoA dioxygenase family)
MSIYKEEMNFYGYTKLGVISQDLVKCLKNNLTEKKEKEIYLIGEDELRNQGRFDLLSCCFDFSPYWVELLESAWLNGFIDEFLNKNATLHDVFCLFNTDGKNKKLTRNKFHRDQPWIKDTRTSIEIFVLLSDVTSKNGPTEVVPSTHLFEKKPSEEFLKSHIKKITGKAGQVYAMDCALWHRAGINKTQNPRPLLSMRFQLAFMRRPLDLCKIYETELESASDLLKTRMGWFCRNADSLEELVSKTKWQPGQYNMENTNVHS